MDEYDIPKPPPPRPDPDPAAYPYGPPQYPAQYPSQYQPQYPPSAPNPAYPQSYPPPDDPYAGYPPAAVESTLRMPPVPSDVTGPGWPGGPAAPAGQAGPLRPVRPSPPPPPTTRSSRPAPAAGRLRGTLGGLLTGLGLLAGSLALAAFVLSTLILNPDRPGQVVKAVLTTPAGRSVATDALASAIRTSVPGISAAQSNQDAAAIIASPALASTLGSSKASVSAALLAQLKTVDPAAAAKVAALPTGVTSTTSPLTALPSGLSAATSKAHSVLRTAEIALLIVAVALVGVALLLGPSRDRILVRVGYWAIAASVVQLFIWWGLPKLFGHFTNGWAQVAAAALRAGGTGLLTVFGALAGLGVLAIVVGYSARVATSRR